MIFRYLLLLLVAFHDSCFAGTKARAPDWDTKPLKAYFRQVEKEKGWVLFGHGNNHYQETPELELYFWAPQKLTLPEARRWYVEEVQKAVSAYQSNQKKSQKPFSAEYLYFRVAFPNSEKDLSNHPFIDCISNVRGQIHYQKYNSQTQRYDLIWEEPYEEAERIVEQEHGCH